VPYRDDQVMHLQADISALSAASGWRPRVTLEEGLRAMVDWYRLS
jgi:nucleoside-diphosphate-sugar epimerase